MANVMDQFFQGQLRPRLSWLRRNEVVGGRYQPVPLRQTLSENAILDVHAWWWGAPKTTIPAAPFQELVADVAWNPHSRSAGSFSYSSGIMLGGGGGGGGDEHQLEPSHCRVLASRSANGDVSARLVPFDRGGEGRAYISRQRCGADLWHFHCPEFSLESQITAMSWCDGGSTLACGSRNGNVFLKPVREMRGRQPNSFTPDQTLKPASTETLALNVWRNSTSCIDQSIVSPSLLLSGGMCGSFSLFDRRLSAGARCTARVSDAHAVLRGHENGAKPYVLSAGAVTGALFDGHFAMVSSGSDNTVKWWDIRNLKSPSKTHTSVVRLLQMYCQARP